MSRILFAGKTQLNGCRQLFAGHLMANENKGKNESNNNLVYFFLITALHLSMIELHLDFSAHRPSFNDQSIIILLPHFNRFTPS